MTKYNKSVKRKGRYCPNEYRIIIIGYFYITITNKNITLNSAYVNPCIININMSVQNKYPFVRYIICIYMIT